MAAARVALACVLVASAAQTGEAAPCAPRAQLGGDAEAVAKVTAELQRLGVEASTTLASPTSCPTIVAAVELQPSGGIAVAVRDASHRSEGRVVSSAALAAAWIDSWLRDDFTAPPPAPLVAPPVVAVDTAAPLVETPVLDRVAFAASFLQLWSDDRTSWSGIGVSACMRLDGVCIGVRAGYATQDVAADLTAAARHDLSLLATAGYSYAIGQMSVAPEVGLGVGRLATTRIDGCKMAPNCDPNDPTCAMPEPVPCTDPGTVYVGDNFSAATYTPRFSAALRIAIPLFDHVWLDGFGAAIAAPFGHADAYPGYSADGTTMSNGSAFPLPGNPLLGLELGVGLRVGAR